MRFDLLASARLDSPEAAPKLAFADSSELPDKRFRLDSATSLEVPNRRLISSAFPSRSIFAEDSACWTSKGFAILKLSDSFA